MKPKCPNCGNRINTLYCEDGELRYVLSVNPQRQYQYGGKSSGEAAKPDDFKCPECQAVLATSEEDATTFLKGSEKK